MDGVPPNDEQTPVTAEDAFDTFESAFMTLNGLVRAQIHALEDALLPDAPELQASIERLSALREDLSCLSLWAQGLSNHVGNACSNFEHRVWPDGRDLSLGIAPLQPLPEPEFMFQEIYLPESAVALMKNRSNVMVRVSEDNVLRVGGHSEELKPREIFILNTLLYYYGIPISVRIFVGIGFPNYGAFWSSKKRLEEKLERLCGCSVVKRGKEANSNSHTFVLDGVKFSREGAHQSGQQIQGRTITNPDFPEPVSLADYRRDKHKASSGDT